MKLRNNRAASLGAIGVALALSLTACASDDNTTETAPKSESSSTAPETPSESPEAAMASGDQFGAGCAAIPADGEGSFDGMADDPVATAASNNPELSTLVTAVTEAGLVDTLNGAQDITVFAPANSAFAALDKATMDAAMAAPKGLLTQVLTLHVVPGKKSPEQLAGTFKTLNGQEITIKGSGEDFTVGDKDANVVCGNVQTANATVYIIDQVLLPQPA